MNVKLIDNVSLLNLMSRYINTGAYMSGNMGSRYKSGMSSSRKAGRANAQRAARSAATVAASVRYGRLLSTARNRGEVKTVDNVVGAAAGMTMNLDTTGSVNCVNLIAPGTTFYQRIGRRVELKSLHLYGYIQDTAVVATAADYGRILVIYDRQTNGVLPTMSTMLLNYDQLGATSTNYLSGLNPDQRERFLILADIRLHLPASSATGMSGASDGATTSFNINRFINLKGLSTQFKSDSATAVIGDIATGGLYIVTIGAYGAPDRYVANLNARLRYQDL